MPVTKHAGSRVGRRTFRLLAKYDPAKSRVWHDTAGTTEGGDGCRIGLLEDLSPNRNHAVPSSTLGSTGAAAINNFSPVLRRLGHPLDGVPCVEITGSGSSVGQTLYSGSAVAPLTRKFFYAIAIKPLTMANSGGVVVNWRSAANGNPFVDFYNASNLNVRSRNNNGSVLNNLASGVSILGSWATIMAYYDGERVWGYVNSATPFGSVAMVGDCTVDVARFPDTGASTGRSTILYGLSQFWEGTPTPQDIENILRETQASYSASVYTADPIPAVAASAPGIESEYRSTMAGAFKLTGSTVTSGNLDTWVNSGTGTNPIDLTLPGGATNPTVQTFNTSNVIQFGASGTPRLTAALSGGVRNVTDFSLYFLIRYTSTSGVNLFTLGNNNNVELTAPLDNTRSFARFANVGNASAGSGYLGIWPARDTSQFYCISVSIDGSTNSARVFADGADCGPYDVNAGTAAQVLATPPFSQYGYQLGYNGASVVGTGFQLGYFGFGLGGHTHYQHRQWFRQMRADFPNLVAPLSRNLVIFTGASNLLTNVDSGNSLPELFLANTSKSVRILNLAMGGTQTQNARARIPYMVARAAEGVTGNVLVAHYAGGNDPTLLGDAIASNTSTNTQTENTNFWTDIAAAFTRAGVTGKRVAFPQLSRSGIDNVGASWRSTYKTWQDTKVGVLFDALVGWDAAAAMYGANTYTDTTYFADGIHHTVAGNTLLYPYLVSAIDPLLV